MLIEFFDQLNSSVSVQTTKITYLKTPYCNHTNISLVEIHFDYPMNKIVVKGTVQEVQDKINESNKGY